MAKLQIRMPGDGDYWQYVVRDLAGRFAYTIYPTRALGAESIDEARATFPALQFRLEPPCRTSPDEAARRAARSDQAGEARPCN